MTEDHEPQPTQPLPVFRPDPQLSAAQQAETAARVAYGQLPWRERMVTKPPPGWGNRFGDAIQCTVVIVPILLVLAAFVPGLLPWVLHLALVVVGLVAAAAVIWLAAGRPPILRRK